MASLIEFARLSNGLAALRAEIDASGGDVSLLANLAGRLSALAGEIANLYEHAFVVALTTSAA